jgi:hypothetical protein
VEIPYRVKIIEESCFHSCHFLSRVTFAPESQLREIGPKAFLGADLRGIEIPSSVKKIGKNCFELCSHLREVTFQEGSKLERIGRCAFSESGIRKVTIPSSVEEIGEYCFRLCKALRVVEFGPKSKIRRLQKRTFSKTGVEEIAIPGSVKVIDEACFYGCKDLAQIAFMKPSNPPFAGSSNDAPSIVCGLQWIEKRAFSGCEKVERLEVPSSVEGIGKECFADCGSLLVIAFEPNSQLKRLGKDALVGTSAVLEGLPETAEVVGGLGCASMCRLA